MTAHQADLAAAHLTWQSALDFLDLSTVGSDDASSRSTKEQKISKESVRRPQFWPSKLASQKVSSDSTN